MPSGEAAARHGATRSNLAEHRFAGALGDQALLHTMIESELLPHFGAHIDGRWYAPDALPRFAVTNPANGETLAELPALDEASVAMAMTAAQRSLSQRLDLEQRRNALRGIAGALRESEQELGRIICLEHGKPWSEGRAEVAYAAGFFAFCADEIDALAPRELEQRPKDCRWIVHRRPAGVAALVTPWNFPIAMVAKKLSAAIAADCPSLLKPSSKAPLSELALLHLIQQCELLPPDRVQLLTGRSSAIVDAIFAHPALRVLSFTGSTRVGHELIRKSADGIVRLALELGGNAPCIIFEDADIEQAVDALLGNKFRGGGQTCVCSNRVLVHDAVHDDFLAALLPRVAELRLGDGMNEDSDIGPLIDRAAFDKVQRLLQDSLDAGAHRAFGEDPAEPEGDDWGCFFPPQVLSEVAADMPCCREEIFGPVIPVQRFRDEREALRLAEDSEHGLAGYFFTADAARAERVCAALRCGHLGWNTAAGPTPEAPFGGMKHSGFGREGGVEGLFDFVELQTVATPV